jgi:hypothetical protein
MFNRIDGYPTSIGSKKLGTVVKFGPAVYAAGGFEVEAVEFGMKAIDFAGAMDADNGLYFTSVRVIAINEDTTPEASVFVQVFDVASGAQVADATNLEAVTFRIWAVGP